MPDTSSFRISDEARRMVRDLERWTNRKWSNVVEIAIKEMHAREKESRKEKKLAKSGKSV